MPNEEELKKYNKENMKPTKYKGKIITIKDFVPVIPDNQLEPIMGKRNTKRFYKWMSGQTRMEGGVYPCDLKAFLTHGINFD